MNVSVEQRRGGVEQSLCYFICHQPLAIYLWSSLPGSQSYHDTGQRAAKKDQSPNSVKCSVVQCKMLGIRNEGELGIF